MGKTTTIHSELISQLLSSYVINPKLTSSCIEFISRALIQNLSESEVSMYLSLCITNIHTKKDPILVDKLDIVLLAEESISSWKIKELGDTDLLIDADILRKIKGVNHYKAYVIGGPSYKDDYSPYYPTKEVGLFSINTNREIFETKADITTDLLVKVDQKLEGKLKEYMLSKVG